MLDDYYFFVQFHEYMCTCMYMNTTITRIPFLMKSKHASDSSPALKSQ